MEIWFSVVINICTWPAAIKTPNAIPNNNLSIVGLLECSSSANLPAATDMPCARNWHLSKQVIELVDEAYSGNRNSSCKSKAQSSFLCLQRTEKIHSNFEGPPRFLWPKKN